MSISLAFCASCWLLAVALTRRWHQAALLSLLWICAFSLFGYVAEALRSGGLLRRAGGEPALMGLFALALFGPSLAIRRTGRALEPLHQYLTLVGVILAGYAWYQVYRDMDERPQTTGPLELPARSGGPARPEAAPDIYLIVLDKYTNSAALTKYFKYDNSEFEAFLRSRGFVVPRHARANYPRTQLALTSMLNLDYIHNLPRPQLASDPIEHNRLAAFLQREGYRFVFFPTAFKFTSRNRYADLQLPPPREVVGEFRAAWERTTMLPELIRGGCAILGCQAARFRLLPETAELMDWKFERLGELASERQPTFVLAHLVLPHEPFLYHADCSHREPYYPAKAGIPGDREATAGYLDQTSCANRKVAALVDTILARSRRPPVILLQSDHGHGRIGRLPAFKSVHPDRVEERMAAFAAYLLPGVEAGHITDSITPVNVMRLLLAHYFGADLPPLTDVSYWSSEDKPLDFVRIEWPPVTPGSADSRSRRRPREGQIVAEPSGPKTLDAVPMITLARGQGLRGVVARVWLEHRLWVGIVAAHFGVGAALDAFGVLDVIRPGWLWIRGSFFSFCY